MKQIKVSASYWKKLSDKERRIFCELTSVYGACIQDTKRILTLTKKYFPAFTEILPSRILNPDLPIYLTGGLYVIKGSEGKLGMISKKCGIGITERVKKYENDNYIEIWHN